MNDDQTEWLRKRAESLLEQGDTYWVGTVTPDGRPHATPVWGVWCDGCFWFTTFATSRKAENLRHNPNVVVHLDSGEVVVILDGVAHHVAHVGDLKPISDRYAAKYVDERTGRPYRPERDLDEGGMLFRVQPARGRTWVNGAYDQMNARWQYRA